MAFSYGVLVGKYEVFPYQQMTAVKHLAALRDARAPRASFDEYRRLVGFPNKIEVLCPPQTEKTGVLAYPNRISAAQQKLIDKHHNVVLGVNTDELVPRVDRYDGCHFGEKAQQLVAAELASSIGRFRSARGGEEPLSGPSPL